MTAPAQKRKREPIAILQLHGRFDGSAKDRRVVRLMNHWGDKAHHDLLLADRGADSAREGLNPGVKVTFLSEPLMGAAGGPGRFLALAQIMRSYDLVLSFGWGAFDAVVAQRMFGLLMNLPPLIHHEESRAGDEIGPLGFSGDFYRRFALGAAHALVVPSGEMVHIAIDEWNEAPRHVHQIPDGIDLSRYAKGRSKGAIAGLASGDRLILGAQIGDAKPEMVDKLLAAVLPFKDKLRLALLDGGGENVPLMTRAKAVGLDDLFIPESLPAAQDYLGVLDIFALLAPDNACPLALTEAMAAGLPIIATDVGDVSAMLGTGARSFLVRDGDGPALAGALARLVDDVDQRRKLGDANRKRALQCFDEAIMFDLYARLYGSAIERDDALL